MHFYNIKQALKKLRKHKSLSIINVLGLSTAMAVCIVIMLFLNNELAYDKHHKNEDRLFRIVSAFDFSGSVNNLSTTPGNAGESFLNTIPEIESFTRIIRGSRSNSFIVEYKDKKIEDKGLYIADSSFFELFSYDFVYGTPQNALAGTNNVVITKSVSEKLFGDQNPIGRNLKFLQSEFGQIFQISGVVDDQNLKSHFNFNYLLSIKLLKPKTAEWLNNWLMFPIHTYITLHENTNEKLLSQKMQETFRKHAGEYADKWGAKVDFELQAISDIHLKSDLEYELESNGDIMHVYYFSIFGLLILVVAIINFVNLVTAHSYSRAGEVGLRKVVGGKRKQLISQFLIESILMSLTGLFISIGLVSLLLPICNQISGIHFTEQNLLQVNILIGMVVMWLVSGVVAGLYPALALTKHKPISSLNNEFTGGVKRNLFVKGLVVFQFVITITLISCTSIILKQVNFLQNVKMSFNPEQTLIIKSKTRETQQNIQNITSEILKNPSITDASFSYTYPGLTANSDNAYFLEGKNENETVMINNQFVGFNYIDFYGLKILEGRNFNPKLSSDSTDSFIINETAAKLLSISGNAVGKKLNNASRGKAGVIVGVIEDFHQESLKNDFVPLIYQIIPNGGTFLAVKINTQNTAQTLEWLKGTWSDFEPHRDMEYFFMDDYFNQLYKNETNMGSIFLVFSIMTIIIASLGLFGLVSFITFQRTKEIGIRKVNGAKTYEILRMLNADFLKLVFIAIVIAIPIGWYAMNLWLENFAYKTELSWWIFTLAGLIALGIAILTVSFQSWRAARMNPVESLRYE